VTAALVTSSGDRRLESAANQRRRSELGLLFIGAVVVLFADLLASLGQTGRLPDHILQFMGVLFALALFVHLVNRRLAPNCDPVVLPIVLVLNGLGYVMISLLNPSYAGNQVAWTMLGAGLYTMTLVVVRRSRDLERYRYLLGLAAFVLLVLPLVPHLGGVPAADAGTNDAGVKLWIHIGSASFQPVEVAKLLLVIFFASYFVEKRELLTLPTRRVGNYLVPDLRSFGPIMVAWAVSLLIIIFERDVGFSLLIFVLFMAMLWVTTGRWTYVLAGFIMFAVGTYLAAHAMSQVGERISVWLDPWRDPAGTGFQTIQAELAFGAGNIYGTGLGLGHASVIPLASSDMIFASLGEDLGLAGAVAIVIGYVLIVGAGLRAALRARSDFARLTAVGLTAVFGFQSFFIMAGVLRLLPLTGLTLPFVAYGGSSLIANYILIALLVRISDEGGSVTVAPRGLARAQRKQRRLSRGASPPPA
jgi:cell division protein FtsW (lipid II flippase)